LVSGDRLAAPKSPTFHTTDRYQQQKMGKNIGVFNKV